MPAAGQEIQLVAVVAVARRQPEQNQAGDSGDKRHRSPGKRLNPQGSRRVRRHPRGHARIVWLTRRIELNGFRLDGATFLHTVRRVPPGKVDAARNLSARHRRLYACDQASTRGRRGRCVPRGMQLGRHAAEGATDRTAVCTDRCAVAGDALERQFTRPGRKARRRVSRLDRSRADRGRWHAYRRNGDEDDRGLRPGHQSLAPARRLPSRCAGRPAHGMDRTRSLRLGRRLHAHHQGAAPGQRLRASSRTEHSWIR